MIFSPVKKTSAGLVLVFVSLAASAWEFAPPEVVSDARPGVFHHLDSAGRRSIAVSGNSIAITWEDNRTGKPVVYAAIRDAAPDRFATVRVSSGNEAYESVVAPLGKGRFIFAWEQDESVFVRIWANRKLGLPRKLSRTTASQISLDVDRGVVHAVWSEKNGKHRAICYARLDASDFDKVSATVVEAGDPIDDQLYPTVIALRDRVWVAWEDRSKGHTRILAAASPDGKAFEKPKRINELGRGRRQIEYGKGPGATRVALARLSAVNAAAVWLDKRDFLGGYDVYTATTENSPSVFWPVRAVQDDFGKGVGQWHPAIAARPDGLLVATWDDDRDGTADIHLAWQGSGGWSANLSVAGANGQGQDTSPSITFDSNGHLHLAWVEREHGDGPTRLRYLRSTKGPGKTAGKPAP